MSYQCFVCDHTFKRSQDRASHIRLKKDDSHRQYFLKQEQEIVKRFLEAVHVAVSVATDASSLLPPILEAPSVQINDVDSWDLPSSRDMEIETDLDELDERASIVSEEAEIVADIPEDEEDASIALSLEEASRSVWEGFDFTDIDNIFDFLPDPELDDTVGLGDVGISGSTEALKRRTLVDEDEKTWTYRWHPTAGKVYEYKQNINSHWRSLFQQGYGSSASDQAYKPFNSRLDWEIAQWATKEKISQKSFDRLLDIPSVSTFSARH